ncbi:hypothetical protein Salat_2787400 [Sesamum alatum]|uniref:Uncharacterized protein n=1 Tax=Sesamum alatum TaxID=300844 RepID=A0AAE1XLW6_9LAMI|nr:hypothetical protein Salat_2787400 [Sesamum alatum]
MNISSRTLVGFDLLLESRGRPISMGGKLSWVAETLGKVWGPETLGVEDNTPQYSVLIGDDVASTKAPTIADVVPEHPKPYFSLHLVLNLSNVLRASTSPSLSTLSASNENLA